MIKTGLYQIHQLREKDTTFFRKELKNISITLYDRILDDPMVDDIAERILLLFSDERGAYKRTYQKRFEEFDQQATSVLEKLFLPSGQFFFHDVGISDGRTALNFFEKISPIFPRIHYLASDYNPSVFIIETRSLTVVLSHTGKILEIVFPPFVFNKNKRDSFRHYPLNHLVRICIEKFFVNSLVKEYLQGHIQARELRLFAPRVLQKAQKDGRFTLGQHDLLQPFKGPFNVIRAMNVLNPSYFSATEFEKVIRNLYDGLIDDGVLITGSNQEAGTIVHGGIYQKHGGKGFRRLYQSGNAAPIEDLILNFKP